MTKRNWNKSITYMYMYNYLHKNNCLGRQNKSSLVITLALVNFPRLRKILSQSRAFIRPCCQTFDSLLTSSRLASMHSPLLGFPEVLIDSVLDTKSERAGGNDALSTLQEKQNKMNYTNKMYPQEI